MLQRPSPQVSVYLDRAALAREEARRTRDENTRAFHERQERAWMNLAASTAFGERVDLFLHTLQRGVPLGDQCPKCHRFMGFTGVESTQEKQTYTLECASCGATRRRAVTWQPVTTAPVDCDVEVAVVDRNGPVSLVFACRRSANRWIMAGTNQPIDVRPTHWRPCCRPDAG